MGEKSTADPNNVQEMDRETDLERVCEIWQSEAKQSHRKFIPETFWNSKKVVDSFRKELSNPQNERYVYEEDRIIKGFIIARNDGYIFEIYVDSPFKRQGIGTTLFETLKGENPKFPQLVRKYSQFTSSVYAHNYESFPWHIKHHFEIFGIRFCPDTGLPKFDMIWKPDRKESPTS